MYFEVYDKEDVLRQKKKKIEKNERKRKTPPFVTPVRRKIFPRAVFLEIRLFMSLRNVQRYFLRCISCILQLSCAMQGGPGARGAGSRRHGTKNSRVCVSEKTLMDVGGLILLT